MGELPAWAAHLPDPLVRLAPPLLEIPQQVTDERPRVVVRGESATARLVEHVEHLAVDVELELLARAVADPNRLRALVAGEPGELELGQAALAGRPVHDLEIVGIAGDRPEEPAPPGARLFDEPVLDERGEREARVAQPAEAIVPVPHASDLLRQRGRGGCDEPAGRGVRHCLQHHQRAVDRLLVAALVRAGREPLVPVRTGVRERVAPHRHEPAPRGVRETTSARTDTARRAPP